MFNSIVLSIDNEENGQMTSRNGPTSTHMGSAKERQRIEKNGGMSLEESEQPSATKTQQQ
jgi:hypothetical protein